MSRLSTQLDRSKWPASWRWRALLLWILVGAVFAALLSRGPTYGSDTSTYLERTVFRTPLYPFVLDLAELVFGSRALMPMIVALQLAAGLVTVILVSRRLAATLQVPRWSLPMAVLLSTPFLFLGIGNEILTESASYTLFLWAAHFLTRSAASGSWSSAWRFLLCLSLLLLTRPQFQVFIPAAFLLVTWLAVRGRSWRKLAYGVLAILLTLGVTLVVEIGANWSRFGFPSRTPLLGLQLVCTAIYVADEEDAALFQGELRERFTRLFETAKEQGLTIHSNKSAEGILAFPIHYNRSNIRLLDFMVPMLTDSEAGLNTASPQDFVLMEKRGRELALPLILRNWRDYARLYAGNVLHRFGYSYPVLILALLIVAVLRARVGDAGAVALLAVLLLHGLNVLVIAALNPLILRFTFYTEVLHVTMALPFLVSRIGARRIA